MIRYEAFGADGNFVEVLGVSKGAYFPLEHDSDA